MQSPPLSLYIHLPWCERKCPYCDFNSHETENIPEQDYIRALLADLDGDLHLAAGRTVETLFIGGGTPSLFSAEAITYLLGGIRERLDVSADLEATMEANPGSAEARKFQGFREAGINRISLGVQSFNNKQLTSLGRIHSAEQAHSAITMARAAGFENFNIDLMHGLPGQTPTDAAADLEQALAYDPPHLSWYQLTLEPNTVFYKRPPVLPVEDVLADIQDEGEALLAQAGMSQYEVSAYSRPGKQCRHNLNYWSFGDYLAIGAGAHGKITEASGAITRYAKTRSPQDYLRADPGEFTASSRQLSSGETIEEFMLFNLRLNRGFYEGEFEQRTGLSIAVVETRLNSLVDKKLLDRQGSHITTTELGRRFLDSVIAEFLDERS